MRRLVYIRWRDAMTDEGGEHPPLAELAELEELGWLLAQTEEAIQIGMELEPQLEGLTGAGRWRLTIPKSGIVEMKEVDFDWAFRTKRSRGGKTKVVDELHV